MPSKKCGEFTLLFVINVFPGRQASLDGFSIYFPLSL